MTGRQLVNDQATNFRVLVLCTGNSARSQIAEALLTTRGAQRLVAASAGSDPAARVNPWALVVLRENGIDWDPESPKGLEGMIGQTWDLVITVCDHARQACPVFPSAGASVHWGLDDPAAVAGTNGEKLEAFREAYRQIDRRVVSLLELPLEQLTSEELAAEARRIHQAG